MLTMTAKRMVLCATAGMCLGFSGLMLSRAEEPMLEKTDVIQAIASLSDMMLPKDNLPKGWKLLDKRLNRDHHDKDLLSTVDNAQMLGVKVSDKKSQSFQAGKESFNVDLFWVDEGLETLQELLKGWLDPGPNALEQGEEQIKWAQQSYEKVIIVIGTSNSTLQSLALKEYLKRHFRLVESKATKAIQDKNEPLALKYFKILFDKEDDFGRIYVTLAGVYLHQLNGPREAMASYETALTHSNKSKFTDEELWSIYEGIGLAAITAPDLKKGEKSFLKSYEIGQKAKNDTWSGSSAYNLACVYAELKDKDKAYKYLETAFKLNKGCVKGASDDTSFKDLKTETRFKDLVRKYDK